MVKEVIKELGTYLGTVLVIFGIAALIYSGLNAFALIKLENSKIQETNLKYLLSFIITFIFISILSFSIIIKNMYKEIRTKKSFISPTALFLILAIIFVVIILLMRYGIIGGE